MRRAIVGAAVLAAVCWVVWAGFATFAAPSETQPTERDVQAAEAVKPPPPVKVKSEPVTFKRVIKPPRAAMAARTQVTMGTAWGGAIEMLAVNDGYVNQTTYPDAPPIISQSVSGIWGTASVTARLNSTGSYWFTGEAEHPSEMPPISGLYWVYDVRASVGGGTTQTYAVAVFVGDTESAGYDDIPEGATVLGFDQSGFSVDWSITVSGIYLKRGRTHAPPDDRSLMDPTDSTITDTWWADETTSVAVTCGSASAQGNLGFSNEEVEIGSSWYLVCGITSDNAPSADTVYARISGITWSGVGVGGSAVDLWKPGLAGTDPAGDGWCRTQDGDGWHVTAGATISMDHTAGTESGTQFTGTVAAPYILTLTPLDGKFDANGPSYAIEYTSNFVTYTDETTYTVDTFSDAYGPIVSGSLSWLYEWEWRKLSSAAIQVRELTAWRTINNEDVGGETETQNDARAAICAAGLSASDCTSEPFWSSGFGFALASSIDINDTQGLPARASPWVGGAGVTVDPVDNDLWTVAAGASAPAVSRTMATRYWLRMDRLASGYTPGLEYHPDWPIMLKANLPILTTEDDTDWWSTATGGVDSEDITNWANRRYLLLGINAARAGTVRLTVTYKVPHPSDPCYTCAEHRWGEWSYTTTTYTRSYDVAVEAGANSKLIDLVLNREKSSVTGNYRMHQVTSVSIALPANPSGSPEAYTLTGLALVLDPGETGRDEPATHSAFRFVPSWAWIGTRWFGYGGWVDGKDALELEYGYSSQHYETKLAYIAHSAHCPESELTSRLDAAKALGRLYNELSWQEGFTPSWPTPTPENNSNNKDADDATVDSSLYWWDLHQSTEAWTIGNLDVALCAGTYNIAAGVPYNLRFYKYPRGALHGIAVNPAYTAVQRNATDLIDVYQALGGTTRVAQLDTDEHGRFRFDAAYEKTALYRLDGGGELTGWLPVTNREYTTAMVECAQYTPVHPCLADGYLTDMHLAFCSEGTIYYRRRPSVVMPWEAVTSVVTGDYPCLLIPPDNCPVMCYQTPSSTTAWLRTKDHGLTWEAVGMTTSGLYPVAAEANGIQYLVTYTSGVGQVIRRSQDYFSTLLTYGAATSALIVGAGSTNAERVGFLKLDASGRMLWTAVPYSNRVYHYGSYDDGATWVAL